MNLSAIAAPAVGAVNPQQVVGVSSNVKPTINPDGTATPGYATPGRLTASIGGTFTASIASNAPTTLVVAAVLTGTLQPTDAISGTDGTNSFPAGCTIVEQLTGSPGGVGTYQISASPAGGQLGSCTVTSASTVLNVTAVAAGLLQVGQVLADVSAALLPGTLITGMGNAIGGIGNYTINQQQTVPSELMTTSMTVLAQIQPLTANDLRHLEGLNLQGSHRALYVSSSVRGVVRAALRGGDLITMGDGSVWLVTQPLESFFQTAGWDKFAITLQTDQIISPYQPSDAQPAGAL